MNYSGKNGIPTMFISKKFPVFTDVITQVKYSPWCEAIAVNDITSSISDMQTVYSYSVNEMSMEALTFFAAPSGRKR